MENLVKAEDVAKTTYDGLCINGEDGMKECSVRDDAVQDALDVQCVPDELIEDWSRRENQAFQPKLCAVPQEPLCLPPPVRTAALSFIAVCAQQAELTQKGWFEASTLLDIFHLKTINAKSAISMDCLLATCAALVCIIKKNDKLVSYGIADAENFVATASYFAQDLEDMGCPSVEAEVTVEMIQSQERHILSTLGWRIHVPTIDSWSTMFIARFNVLTRNLLVQKLQWVQYQSLSSSQLLMMKQAFTKERSPRTLAVGLLGIGLVAAGLFPMQAFKPPNLTCEEWSDMFKDIQANGQQPHCQIPPCHSVTMMQVFMETIGADLIDIQECCHVASLATRDALC